MTFVVGSGIFVFEGHDLDIGNPNVEGEALVASTPTEGNEKGDSARPSMKRMGRRWRRCGCCNDRVGARHWRWRPDEAYMRHWFKLGKGVR